MKLKDENQMGKITGQIHLTWDKHMKCDGVTSVT